jgi:hypothetical protein
MTISEMTKAGGQCTRVVITTAALVLAMLCVPAIAGAAVSGVDQYTERSADADGKGNVGSQPVARPEDLPKSVRDTLAHQPDGDTLTRIATARELGAPPPAEPSDLGNNEKRSLPAAAAHALGSGGTVLLLVALLAIGALGAFAYSRRRTQG